MLIMAPHGVRKINLAPPAGSVPAGRCIVPRLLIQTIIYHSKEETNNGSRRK